LRSYGLLYGVFVVAKLDRSVRDDFLYRLRRRKLTYRFIRRHAMELRIAKGVATTNFAALLKAILSPIATYSVDGGDAGDFDKETVVDTGGASATVATRGAWSSISSGYWGCVFNGLGGYTPYETFEIGSFFKVGSGTATPTQDDYELANPIQEFPSTDVTISNGIITVTGGGTADQDMTVTEIGIYMKLLKHLGVTNASNEVISVLLDRSVISGVSYSAGDPVALQYRIKGA